MEITLYSLLTHEIVWNKELVEIHIDDKDLGVTLSAELDRLEFQVDRVDAENLIVDFIEPTYDEVEGRSYLKITCKRKEQT